MKPEKNCVPLLASPKFLTVACNKQILLGTKTNVFRSKFAVQNDVGAQKITFSDYN